MKFNSNSIVILLLLAVCLAGVPGVLHAQDLGADFYIRFYNDKYMNAEDNRESESFIRYMARIRAKWQANPNTTFYTEVATFTDANPVTPVRGIAGTGTVYYGISQVFAQLNYPDVICFDQLRFRVGRQQFPIGKGLSMGESYYFVDKFDGARLDLSVNSYNISLFGAITGQNVSPSGLWPEPGSDQVYAARLAKDFFRHTLMGYYIYQRPRNDFNDSYILGLGLAADRMNGRLDYYLEGAWQNYNTLEGLPETSGIGYMGGIGYRWSWKWFSSIKVETQYAAYQGDDSETYEIERFSPLYPSFFWGDRNGYVNGAIGGDYPYDDRNPEGSRIWYTRFYVRPESLPDLRLQIQYIKISEYVNRDDYNVFDDEFAIKAYYNLSRQTTLQFRYAIDFSNSGDEDLNDNGIITRAEDRVTRQRLMFEVKVQL